MSSSSQLRAAQLLLLILGFSLLVVGAYFPTIARAVSNAYALTTITVTGGGGTPTSITEQIVAYDYNAYQSCPTPTCSSTHQEPPLGSTFQLGGVVNVKTANLAILIQVNIGSSQYSIVNAYVTDGQGNWGSFTNGGTGDGNLIQIKADGLYVKSSHVITQTLTTGTVITFQANIASASSNQVTVKISGSGVAPTGTVKLVGGNGQSFTIDSSSNVQTTSPLKFTVTITQGADNIQSANLQYWVYSGITQTPGSGLQTSPLTSCGTNVYCGTLNLTPGTYTVKVHVTPKQGQDVTMLSILGFFDVPSTLPQDYSYYVGAAIMIVGAMISIGGAFMPVSRRYP